MSSLATSFVELVMIMRYLHPLLMVPVLAAVLLAFAPQSTNAQAPSPFFYYYDGARIYLTLDPSRVAVQFAPGASDAERRALTNQNGEVESLDRAIDAREARITLIPVKTGHDPLVAISKFGQQAQVASVGRVFHFQDGSAYAETGEFIARFKSNVSPVAIRLFNLANGVQTVRQQANSNDVLILRPLRGNPRSTLDLANTYAQSGLTEFAEPNFLIVKPAPKQARLAPTAVTPVTPNDTNFSWQWALNYTGQYAGEQRGANINATRAWGLTQGSSQIKIAIIDEGVASANPDLAGKVLTGQNVTVFPNNTNTEPNANNFHGTATAGIAAANTNNIEGIAGVCPLCQILPVKVAYEQAGGVWFTTTAWLAHGIDWAWQHGADVLSNSWTMSGPSSDVRQAIQNAVVGGRETYGSTVLFAAGNENSGTVSFPASMNNYVIAVGASNWCNQRKTNANDDCNNHENWWGSNYGTALDVVAPGQVILTTCNGVNCVYKNYTWFSGTSASTPMVAGIVGLIYSLNPDLTPAEVQQALQQGAVDIAPAGRDDATGYGRADAFNSLKALYDLSLGMQRDQSSVRAGDVVQFTLTFTNVGLTTMASPTVQVTLPAGLTYQSSDPAFTSLGGGVYELTAGDLPRYQSGSAKITGRAEASAVGQTLTVTAKVTGASPELNRTNNTATNSFFVFASDIFLPLILY